MAEPVNVDHAVDVLLLALAGYEPDSAKAVKDARASIVAALRYLGVSYERSGAALDAYVARRQKALADSRGILRDLEIGQRGGTDA